MVRRAKLAIGVLAFSVGLLVPQNAVAQGVAGALAPMPRWSPAADHESSPSLLELNQGLRREAKRTQWVRGGLIGAGVGAVAVGVLAAVACSAGESDDSCTGDALIGAGLGAGLGFLVGALVGGAFSSSETPATAQ
jgi:hypothetical protein